MWGISCFPSVRHLENKCEAARGYGRRGSEGVTPGESLFAALRHSGVKTRGGREGGERELNIFSLVCISCCLLQLCAESERTADRLHPDSSPSSTPAPPSLRKRTCYPQEGISGCVAWGSATGIYVQDPARYICIIRQYIQCSEFVSLQVLNIYFFLLW